MSPTYKKFRPLADSGVRNLLFCKQNKPFLLQMMRNQNSVENKSFLEDNFVTGLLLKLLTHILFLDKFCTEMLNHTYNIFISSNRKDIFKL